MRLRRDQRGISLIEVMLTASILSVVLGAIFSLSQTTAQLAPEDQERTHVVEEARAGMTRITRDTREATTAAVADSGYSLSLTVRGQAVTYACRVSHPTIEGRSRCTRTDAAGTSVIADHLLNVSTSTAPFVQDGSYVTTRLRVASRGDRKDGRAPTVTLDDGAYVRNIGP